MPNRSNENYPNYEFEIVDTQEKGVNCWMFGCSIKVFDNIILDKKSNLSYSIYVKKEDLTIYEDYFQEVIHKKNKGV